MGNRNEPDDNALPDVVLVQSGINIFVFRSNRKRYSGILSTAKVDDAPHMMTRIVTPAKWVIVGFSAGFRVSSRGIPC